MEGFALVYGPSRSLSWWERQAGRATRQLCLMQWQSGSREQMLMCAWLSLFYAIWVLVQGKKSVTVRLSLPISIHVRHKVPHRHAEDPFKWAISINHHRWYFKLLKKGGLFFKSKIIKRPPVSEFPSRWRYNIIKMSCLSKLIQLSSLKILFIFSK